jgi:DNA-directed RNA polymerase subunit RPC12/RpoP
VDEDEKKTEVICKDCGAKLAVIKGKVKIERIDKHFIGNPSKRCTAMEAPKPQTNQSIKKFAFPDLTQKERDAYEIGICTAFCETATPFYRVENETFRYNL